MTNTIPIEGENVMSSTPISGELVIGRDGLDDVHLAMAGYLARYKASTRRSYVTDLRAFMAWCESVGLPIMSVRRPHLETWARYMSETQHFAASTVARRLSTVAGFYRYAQIDGYIEKNPAEYVRRPRVSSESPTLGLDRHELGAVIYAAEASSPADHCLICFLGLLGLRVGEACSVNIEDLGSQRGHRTLHIVGKGDKPAVMPLPPRVGRAVDQAKNERVSGPLMLNRSGHRMNRHNASRVVKRIVRKCGIDKKISPHSLRHSFITAALDAGVPLRDVQIAARHADPRTTTRYDRARHNLDRHASYTVASFIAGAA